MDRTEISEIFCGAVDTIINARLKNLAYDITKEFVITKNDLQKQGLYTVSDGSVSFEAYSYDKTLKVNDKVMVTIPNGDYNSNKIITAKIEPEKPDMSTYTSQLDLMQIFTDNILTTHTYEVYDNPGILANDQGQSSYIKLYEIHNNRGDLSGYTRLGISADFQSLLNNLDVVKGDYGLKILIYTSMPKAPGEPRKEHPYVFDLGAADMIGNPYKYSAFSKQQKIIDISIIEDLSRIELYLYQNGDFEDSNGNLISSEHVNNILEIPVSSYPNNLFVKNIEVYLGYELGEYENDKMQIYCQNSLYYSYADITKVKNLQLKWLHKFDNNQYKMMDMSALNDMGITLKWYRYNTNVKEIDNLAGRHWEEIPTGADKFKCSFTPNTDLKEERIKVIGYKVSITKESISVLNSDSGYLVAYKNLFANLDKYKDANGEIDQAALDRDLKELQESFLAKHNGNIESVLKYTSDELVFKNTVEVFDISTFNATSALSIYYKDGSDGNYYIYNSNGKLPSANKGRGYERVMQAIYNGQEITAALGTLDYIEWWLPTGKDSKTMLASTSAYYVKDDGEIYRENELYAGVNYVRIRRFPNAAGELVTTQSYSINNNWSNTYNNNLIRCEVSINGIRHLCSSTMHFGKSGTQGSNTTLVLELFDNNNAITIPVPKNSSNEYIKYGIEAKAFDINGDPVSPKLGEWKWQWKTPMLKNVEGKEILVLIPREDEPHIVDIEVNIDSLNQVRNGYYGIVQASFKQANEIELTTYLSIPLKAEDISHIEGATDIIYSASGSPSYYSDAYKIFINTINDSTNPFTEIRNVDWDVVHDLEFYKLDKQGQPVINEFTGEKEVSTMSEDYIPKLHSLIRTDNTGLSQTYQALQAAPFFAEGYDKICVTCARDSGNYKSVGFLSYYDYRSHYYYTFNEAISQFTLSNTYIPKTEYFELQKDIIWVQPLLITTNNYENSTTNNWDGTLMTDEGSGTVMATIVGAGRKNSDNTFSGVLMGEVKDNSDNSPENFVAINYLNEQDFYTDSYYYKDENGQFVQAVNYDKNETYYSLRQATGLYGFQNGEISFSLKDTGIATFGKSGKGQIIMDGNTSIIKSQSFSTLGSGMKIDLDEGILDIKDNGRLKIKIAPYNDSYLLINGSNEEKPIMKISGDECFLQSQQRSLGGLGTHFDLVEGVLDINGTGGNVLLSGRAQDPFFKVTTRQNNTLIHMDTDQYYLQSAYFTAENQIRLTDDELQLEIYKEKDYVPVAISIETYMNEMDKYYVLAEGKSDEYIPAAGKYNCDIQYYRLGNDDIVYGFDPHTYNLYTLEYDEEKDQYAARIPIDVYECDDVGNFIYPIMWFIEKYEKAYAEITLTQEQFNENQEDYYAKVDGIYISVENQEWKPDEENGLTGTYYQLYYYPKINEINGDSEETIIGTQIYNYVQRELTPVRTRGVPSGMKLDLVDGKIEGYNLKLVGTKIKDDGQGNFSVVNRLIINTEDDELPLQIGKNFRVHWDGEVECTKVTKISYTKGPLEDTTRSVMKKVYKADLDEVVEEEVAEEIPQTFFIDFVNGQFNGMAEKANTAEEALAISDDILNTWWQNKNNSSDDNNKHFNVYQLKQYLADNYLPIRQYNGVETLSAYAKKSDLDSYATQTELDILRQNVKNLSDEVTRLSDLIAGIT